MFLGQHSLILRLDPNHIFNFVLDDEFANNDRTIFRVKPLSILQYSTCKDLLLREEDGRIAIGLYHFNIVRYGLVGWKNYMYIDNGEEILFSEKNINTLPYNAIEGIARGILELSEVDSYTEKQIRLAIQWSDYLSKLDNPDQWKCEICRDGNFASSRNCDGKALNKCFRCKIETPLDTCPKCGKATKPKFFLRLNSKLPKYGTFGVDWVTRCPSAMMNPKIVSVINAINYMDDTKSLPIQDAALNQSNYYYQVRQIMLSQRNEAFAESTRSSNSKQSHSVTRNADLVNKPRPRR